MAEEITKDTETTEVVEKTVPYDRFNKVIEERNTYKTSTAEKDAQIAALNEKLKAFEGYVPSTELEKAKAETQKTYEDKLSALTIQSKIENKLILEGLDAEFLEFALSKVDVSALKNENGKIIGLDDTITGIKEKYPKMFATTTKTKNNEGAAKGGTPPAATDEEAALKERVFKAAGLKI